MGYLPDHGLTVWRQGDQLSAATLNANFAVLLEYVEQALTQALTPDAAVVALEMRLGRLEERLAALEGMAAMHERQRNEKQYAPLATVAHLLQRLEKLEQAR